MDSQWLVKRKRLIQPWVKPFERFAQIESSSGILLMVCAVAAVGWANSQWSSGYFHLWEIPVTVSAGTRSLSTSVHHWINDGLMAIFFFVVGLEIKREILVGELAAFRKAALPIAGALGGIIVPALIYASLNFGGEGSAGWGVPMATDIAFALGVLALIGKGVPLGLKVFLTALAIVDDLAAVLVIALFYSATISGWHLALAAVLLLLLCAGNWAGISRPAFYVVLGLGLWLAVFQSGIHATVAGVLLAMTIPARAFIDVPEFIARGREYLDRLEKTEGEGRHIYQEARLDAVHALEGATDKVESPLLQFEHTLLPWVTFLILPVFALANAGVALPGDVSESLADPVALGIMAGLVLGKPLGIVLVSWVSVRIGWASLPSGVRWRHMAGVGFLGGIGFTMSLFITNLAFGGTALLDIAKIGVLCASVLAGVAGWLILRGTADANG